MSKRNFGQQDGSQQQTQPVEMNIDTFWEMIERAHKRAGNNIDNRHRSIREESLKLSVPDAIEFNRLFERELSRSYMWELADAAAELITGEVNDGLSGDVRFLHFRIALMPLGRKTYNSALESPEVRAGSGWFLPY